MKIALSADGRSPHTERWANAFATRGHTVTVIWRADLVDVSAMKRYLDGVDHLVAASRWSSTTNAQPSIESLSPAKLRHRIRPDIVQGMYLVDFGWMAARLGRPLVQFAMGSDVLVLDRAPEINPRRALGHAYVKWRTLRAINKADVVLCDSEQVRSSLRTHAPQTQIEIVRIGAELARDAGSHRNWRSELAIADDAFVVLSTRLMKPNYNIETIIRAHAKVLAAVPDCVLVLKDFELFGDPAYRTTCDHLITELGTAASVRRVGELSRPDLLALYRAADVFVSVPTNDATAVSVLEAMAASVPIVASLTAGLDPAVLRDGESALLVRPQDAFELTAAITRLCDSSVLRERLAEEGERTVRTVGDFDRGMDRAEEIYMEVLSAPDQGPSDRL